ncbi:MAG TPA: HEAT repeat domain-containing protein [Chloroflexia bacterium]|nr:HEAT repeat domain-containing protein [Chloroflexia bacterium]
MDFATTLNGIIADDHPLPAASLTFLSDIPSEHRATLALMWPGIALARRRKIVATLVTLAEDNIEYDFTTVFGVLLADPDAQVRRLAIEGLVEDESINTVRRLIGVLDADADSAVRAAAANALGPAALRAETGKLKGEWPERLRSALLRAVRDPAATEEVRRRALESVAYFCANPDVEAEIARAYGGGSQLLQASAIHAMGRNMSRRWTPLVLQELHSPEPMLRFEAAQAVGELGERANVPALLPLLEDDDLEVQLAAIGALGQLGGRVAIQALQMLAPEADATIREAVDEALMEIRYASDPLGP